MSCLAPSLHPPTNLFVNPSVNIWNSQYVSEHLTKHFDGNLAKHFVAINGLLPARCRVDGTYLHNTFERWLWKSGDWEFMNLVTNELKHFWVSVTAPARRAVFKKWPPHHFAYIGFVDDLSPFNSRIRIRPSYFIEDMYCRTVCVLNDMHVIRTWTEENILLNYSFLIWF